MAYQALYREWRPKDFSHVVGQKAIIDTLRNQVVSRRIAHAYLFCGSRGTGKTSTAKILAKAINCLSPDNGDPCGVCENCLRLEREETLDVIEIDAASNNGVDEMRELRDTVKYPPQYGCYKVYIIDEVHMLSVSAFNALLKTLEEPPAHVVFILATTEPQKLPETILSRCQRFDFGRISIAEISGRLREAAEGSGAQVSDGALMLIARAAEGGMRDALSILDMCLGYCNQVNEELVRKILGTSDSSFVFEFCDALTEQNAGRVFRMIDQLMRDGKDPAVFAKDISRHIRCLLIAKTSPEDLASLMSITDEEAHEYIRQSEKATCTKLMKILDLYMGLGTEMRYTSSPRMALENTSLKSCLRTTDTDEKALSDRITELEIKLDKINKKLENGTLKLVSDKDSKNPEKTDKAITERKSEETERSAAKKKTDNSAVWKQFMSMIRQKDMTAWSFLSQGELVSCRDGMFCWQASRKEGEQQFILVLNNPERKKCICSCLSEITGEECSFSAVERDSLQTSGDSSDDAYLKTLYDTFGREPVSIVDEIK